MPALRTASGAARPARRRDALQTRSLLLQVARRRFARDGYATTTVRDISDEAGVNVSLISRYFASKEGLFEACLTDAVTELDREAQDTPLADMATAMARRIAGSTQHPEIPDTMLLLLRSSGDERIDEIRRSYLHSITRRMAAATGAAPTDQALLRAQIVLATALGMTLLRLSPGIQPLAGATEDDLTGPFADLITALLAPGA